MSITATPDADDISSRPADAPLHPDPIDPYHLDIAAGLTLTSTYGFPAGSPPQINFGYCQQDPSGKKPWEDGWVTTVAENYQVGLVGYSSTTTSQTWTHVRFPYSPFYALYMGNSVYSMTEGDWEAFRPGVDYPGDDSLPALIGRLHVTFVYYSAPGPSSPVTSSRDYYLQFVHKTNP